MAVLAVLAFVVAPMLGTASPLSGAITPPAVGDSEAALLDLRGVRDSDMDGVGDALENYVYGSDPAAWSSNGDPVPDGWYARYGHDPLLPQLFLRPAAMPPADALPPAYGNEWPSRFTPTLWDVYAHGRPADWDEATQGPHESGLDPREWDQDGDGIADGFLLAFGLDPLAEDVGPQRLAGPDGLTVREAFGHRTDPRSQDSDRDGLTDREEIDGPRNPLPDGPRRFGPTDPARASTTGSGACDGYLVAHGLDPTVPANGYGDPDGDGATTLEEYLWSRARFGDAACKGEGADPTRLSTAGLPIPDGWLIRYDLDLLDAATPAAVTQESATDPGPILAGSTLPEVSLTVLDEYGVGRPPAWEEARDGPWWGGTDPTRVDTDGDGLGDAWELRGYAVSVRAVPTRQEATVHNTTSDPTLADSDGDGLSDGEEASPDLGPATVTDARRRDTDFDGIDDGAEVLGDLGLDPLRADSAGDLLRDGVRLRFLQEHAAAYALDLLYEHEGQPGVSRSVADWLGEQPGAADLSKPLSKTAVAELVGPLGDLDGDGTINLLDDDLDDDDLRNGFELTPRLYESSEFGAGRLAGGRPASDPLNPDTDGDGLPDGWEVRHGIEDHALGVYNLDPSRWDSDGDGTGDADEDPDADSITWYAYSASGGLFERQEKRYEHTNRAEFEHSTHPNQASDEGGLLDGWRVFWGVVYPTLSPTSAPSVGDLYPGSEGGFVALPALDVRIDAGAADDVLLTLPYERHVLRTGELLEWETAKNGVNVPGPRGDRTVYPVLGEYPLTLLQAQEARINPYMALLPASTDGDGMADAWEILHQGVLPGTADAQGDEQAGCVAGVPGPDPTLHDAGGDLDGDGLPNGGEHEHGADPLCQDSDLGLLLDGQEVSDALEVPLDPADPRDDRQLLDSQEDGDGDGLFDFEELTGTGRMGTLYGHLGLVRSDPNNPDTDRDGLLDGPTFPDPDAAGLTLQDPLTQRFLDLGIAYYTEGPSSDRRFHFLGEGDAGTDPRNGDDTGTGIPAGWLAAYSLSLGSAASYTDQYTLARPLWWDESVHSVWWGGASPLLYPNPQAMETLRNDPDLDQDGLRDRDDRGDPFEDPMPGANGPNALRAVDFAAHGLADPGTADPADDGLSPLEARLLGQAYLNPRTVGAKALERPAPETLQAPARDAPCISGLVLDGEPTILKGTPKTVRGSVLASCPGGAPVPGLTVEARMGVGSDVQVFGLGVTAADGTFAFPVDIAAAHETTLPDAAVAMGQRGGTLSWTTSPAAIVPGGGHTLRVTTYALADPADPDGGWTRSEVERIQGVTVRADSAVSLPGLPETAPSGSDITLRVVLTDSTGTPLRDPVRVRLGDQPEKEVFPDADGAAGVTFSVPHSLTGDVAITATSVPQSAHVRPGEVQETVRFLQPATLRLGDLADSIDAGGPLPVSGRLATAAGAVPGAPVTVDLSVAGQLVQTATATTGPDGAFRVDLDLAPTMPRGTYLVQATAAETASTASVQSVQEAVTVRSLPRFAAVSTDALDAADGSFNVTGRLLEPDGSPLPGAPVTVLLGDAEGEATTGEDGAFTARVQVALEPRPVLQSLRFAGDPGHAPSRLDVERTVHTGTTLHVPADLLARGGDAEVAVLLNQSSGGGVPGAPVLVSWGDEPPQTAVTDADGRAVLHRPGVPDDRLGPVVVRASYAGSADGTLGASTASSVWVVEAQARLTLPSGPVELGIGVPAGTLQDAGTGEPVQRQSVRLTWTQQYLDGTTEQLALDTSSDDDGRFEFLPTTPRDAQPSRIALTAVYAGSDQYDRVETTSTLLLRSPTALTVQAPSSLVAGQHSIMLVHVTDGRGLPVTGGLVNATLGDAPVGQATVEDGVARIDVLLPADQAAGPASLRFRFNGTDTHGDSRSSHPVDVVSAPHLDLRIQSARAGQVAVVQAVASAGGEPLAFVPVRLQVEGLPSGMEAVTDEDGVATFHVLQGNATMRMAASLGADDGRSPATSHAVLQPVPPGTPGQAVVRLVVWVAAGLGLLLGATALLARRLRRHELAPALRRARLALKGRGPYEEQILKAYRILEDAAIAHEILDEPAMTPRLLEEAIAATVVPDLHPSLHRLISSFEVARYGKAPLDERHRDEAVLALDDLRVRLSKMDPFWAEADAPGGSPA